MRQICTIEEKPYNKYLLVDINPNSLVPQSMVRPYGKKIQNDFRKHNTFFFLYRIRGNITAEKEDEIYFFVPKDV